ncbi:MAG: hypothetical protein Ct9H300mP2_4360 [Candidatus Neomarinimicrobiota bacterium]|nr:MAG: hypothetical protein Ct9H300mP2_4360 [Candidatus Neomarinimicrobiota bacterium]
MTDPAPATAFAHLDATTVLERKIAELGIYPAIDPLTSTSRILDPRVIGDRHYRVARNAQRKSSKNIRNYRTLSRFLVWMNFPMKINLWSTVPVEFRSSCHSLFLWPSNLLVLPGRYVSLEDTVSGFEAILNGEVDEFQKVHLLT